MRKLIIFLMVLSFVFMSVTPSVFAVFTAVNIGPTTDLDGDVNIPAGKSYYINEVEVTASTLGGATKALDNLASVAINAALVLGTTDQFALGSATKMWADLFLASGGVINFDNGNLTLTHSAGVLTLGGSGAVDLALGTNDLTLTGSIGATGARVTKIWTAALESTADITINGTALASIYMPIFTGTDTHVMFFDGANSPAGDAGMTYNKTTDALTAVTFIGALQGNADTCTTAAAGDAAVDFFGAGVDAVTDATTCTDLEGDHLSITTSILNVGDDFILNTGDIGTGVYDFGGADSFEITNSATPTLDAAGEIAYDTTVIG